MDFSRLSQGDLSKAIGIPTRTIRSWADIPRNEDRTYSLPTVVQWLISRVEDSETAAPLDPVSQEWLGKFRRERFRLARIERKEREGLLVPRAAIVAAWTARVAATVQTLVFLTNRLPPLLVGKDQQAMYDIIEDEVRRARLAHIADGPYTRLPAGCIFLPGGRGCDGRLPGPADPSIPPGSIPTSEDGEA